MGLSEVENFEINLRSKFRSEKFKDRGEEVSRKMVQDAMKLKMKDEQRYREELMKRRNTMRREIEKQYGKNSRPFRRRMAILRE